MNWTGKAAGAVLGFAFGGPIGAAVGAAVGHQFDKDAGGSSKPAQPEVASARTREIFFAATFQLMGNLATDGGRSGRAEYGAAPDIVAALGLPQARVADALAHFDAGSRGDFDRQAMLRRFGFATESHADLRLALMETLTRAALVDGRIQRNERRLLWEICQTLGLSRVEFAQIEALVRVRDLGAELRTRLDPLEGARQVLGVDADTPLPEVKKAYRRLLSRHHPDKLLAQGLPEALMADAQRKTHEIRQAYERIRDARRD